MMGFCTRAALSAAVVSVGVFSAGQASAQSSTDPFQGATVTANSPTIFAADNTFDGDVSDEANGRTVFSNGGLNFIEFTIAAPVSLSSVDLFSESDGNVENGDRSTTVFSLLADADNDLTTGPGGFEVTLGSASDVSDASILDAESIPTASTLASRFRAEFTAPANGNRIGELDAVAVPEPTTLALLGLGGLGLLARRRRGA